MSNQMFLKLDGVPGESTDSRHPQEIEVLGWGWGLAEPAAAPGGPSGSGARRIVIQAIALQKFVDVSSPILMLLAAEGRRIATGVVTTRHASGGDFLLFKMTDIRVTSVVIAASTAANQLAETLTLTFGKIEFDYRTTVSNGSLGPMTSFRWDLAANAPF